MTRADRVTNASSHHGHFGKNSNALFQPGFRGTIGSSQLSINDCGLQLLYLQYDTIQTMEGKFSCREKKRP